MLFDLLILRALYQTMPEIFLGIAAFPWAFAAVLMLIWRFCKKCR